MVSAGPWSGLVSRFRRREEVPGEDRVVDTAPVVLYDLVGVVNHQGSLNQGHYTADVRIEEQWFRCNDVSVKALNHEEDVREGCGNNPGDAKDAKESTVLESSQAYILFYIRR